METPQQIMQRLASTGKLQRNPGTLIMSPVPSAVKGHVSKESAELTKQIAPGLDKEDFDRLMEANPETARAICGALQGSELPAFPMGGVG